MSHSHGWSGGQAISEASPESKHVPYPVIAVGTAAPNRCRRDLEHRQYHHDCSHNGRGRRWGRRRRRRVEASGDGGSSAAGVGAATIAPAVLLESLTILHCALLLLFGVVADDAVAGVGLCCRLPGDQNEGSGDRD